MDIDRILVSENLITDTITFMKWVASCDENSKLTREIAEKMLNSYQCVVSENNGGSQNRS